MIQLRFAVPRIVQPEMVAPVVGVLLGAIDTGDGGTDEQRAVLAAIVGGYWERPGLDLGTLRAVGPEDAPLEDLRAQFGIPPRS